MKSQSPEHWSKDFVEHLRTVHFALVTVSVGLILILSSKSYDVQKAASEMNEVVRVSSAPWLISPKSELNKYPDFALPYSPWFEAEIDGRSLIFHSDGNNLYYCSDKQKEGRSPRFEQLKLSLSPHTIGTLAPLWDFLSTHSSRTFTAIRFIVRDGGMTDIETGGNTGVAIRAMITKSLSSRTDSGIELHGFGICNSTDPPYLVLGGHDLSHRFKFMTGIAQAEITHEPLEAEVSSTVKSRAFEDNFHDLVEAARGREDLDFAILAPQIYAEAAKGDEAFEAFGIKIPSNEITGWGVIVLIGVQLYLLMYLRRLSNKLTQDDPGWDVPWMAMDESRLARVMLFVSLIVLPLLAALSIFSVSWPTLWSAAMSLIPKHQHTISNPWSVGVRPLLICLGCCSSAWLSVQCWRNRPRLCEPVAPAQLFE
jgi:hypothetical protein